MKQLKMKSSDKQPGENESEGKNITIKIVRGRSKMTSPEEGGREVVKIGKFW